ncbi:sialic acid-binding Ig-like lectin 13 [Odontesthes bonariensis]
MVTVSTLLTIFFVSDALASCPNPAALVITTPEIMDALSGSCLQIPCTFAAKEEGEFNGSRTSFGAWIKSNPKFAKNPDNVIFNSSTKQIYPMRITGSLTQKNCTTLFSNLTAKYTDTYYFRVNNWPFQATASCSPLQIIVKDSAWKPTINISGELKERESVTITCSALTPCPHSPPELTWNLQQNSHRQIEENTDGTFTAKIQETITLSDTHNGSNISCSVRYPVNAGKDVKTAETEVTLSVSLTEQSPPWPAAVGGTIATILLICVIFLIWWLKSKRPTSHPSQSLVLQEPASTAENQDIHYGEIDFSVMRLSSDSAHEATQQQNTVYSQVNVHKAGGDIYASVKRK